MRDLPNWEWPILITLQALLGLVSGLLTALLTRSILMIITSFILSPIIAVVVSFIMSAFFYYTFLFVFKRETAFRAIFTHMLFASIPVLVTNIASPVIPLVGLVGVLASAFLLYVGFISNFYLNERKVRYLIGGLAAVYVISVVVQLINFRAPSESMQIRATPESLDILERELNQ